jgi:hypothetical protein
MTMSSQQDYSRKLVAPRQSCDKRFNVGSQPGVAILNTRTWSSAVR